MPLKPTTPERGRSGEGAAACGENRLKGGSDGRQMGSGGKRPLDQLLALRRVVLRTAHLRCYVCRRKRVEDDCAKAAEEEGRVKELRARPCAGKEGVARISENTQ